jgi:hypothetical protein
MKKFKSSKRFENFLRKCSQSTLELNEDQIDLLSPGLSYSQVLLAVKGAEWVVRRAELRNDGLVTFSLHKKQTCSCGKLAQHYHLDDIACCGSNDCCPESQEEPDYEIEIAWAVSCIREILKKRNEKAQLQRNTHHYQNLVLK